jgi:hypothetical protein
MPAMVEFPDHYQVANANTNDQHLPRASFLYSAAHARKRSPPNMWMLFDLLAPLLSLAPPSTTKASSLQVTANSEHIDEITTTLPIS